MLSLQAKRRSGPVSDPGERVGYRRHRRHRCRACESARIPPAFQVSRMRVPGHRIPLGNATFPRPGRNPGVFRRAMKRRVGFLHNRVPSGDSGTEPPLRPPMPTDQSADS